MKFVYLLIAYLALLIGFIGVILPGLPAAEFFILAAWAAGKSSPRLHAWMLNHQWIGPPLRDWKHGGVVALHTKLIATCSMLIAAIFLGLKVSHLPSLLFSWAGMTAGAIWLWSRPTKKAVELKP